MKFCEKSFEYIFSYYCNCLPSFMYVKDLDLNYVFINQKCENLFGIMCKELNEKKYNDFDFFDDSIANEYRQNDKKVLKTNTLHELLERGKFYNKDLDIYEERYYLAIKFPLYDNNGKLIGLCGFSHEITKMKELELKLKQTNDELLATQKCLEEKNKKLLYFAQTDHLTKLLNRGAIEEKIKQEIEILKRVTYECSLLLIDVDHFKLINDVFGHDKGDEILIEISKLMKGITREIDALGRWGGEEFIMLLPHTSEEEAFTVAEKIRKCIEFHKFNDLDGVTMSIGVCSYKEKFDFDTWYSTVDKALYYAKQSGRNCVKNTFLI